MENQLAHANADASFSAVCYNELSLLAVEINLQLTIQYNTITLFKERDVITFYSFLTYGPLNSAQQHVNIPSATEYTG